jgi:uncharacterized protein YybS (DUF2232 family)
MPILALRDWLACTLVSCLLFAAGALSQAAAVPATLICSLPFAWLASRQGGFASVLSAAAASASLCTVLPPVYGVMYFVGFGAPGAAIGALCGRERGAGELMMAASALETGGKVAGALVFYLSSGINLMSPKAEDIASLLGFMSAGGGTTGDTVSGAALGSAAGTALPAGAREAIESVILLVPYSIVALSAAEALFCLAAMSWLQRRAGGRGCFSPPPFSEWAFPKSLMFALLVGFVCSLASENVEGSRLLRIMGANLTELSRTLFIIEGMSAAYFFMRKKGVPRAAGVAAVVIAPLAPPMGDILAILGIAEMCLGLREKSGRDQP